MADAIAQHNDLDRAAARRAVLHGLPTPDFREATAAFLALWHATAGVGAEAAAVALVTAAECERERRHGETVEVVWTGPEPADARFRQTEQTVLEVIDSAAGRLTVVSVERQPHRVRLQHQHGVGPAGDGRGVAGAGGAALRATRGRGYADPCLKAAWQASGVGRPSRRGECDCTQRHSTGSPSSFVATKLNRSRTAVPRS